MNPFKINDNTFLNTDLWVNGVDFYENTYKKAMLYIPPGTLSKYKATASWKKFAKIEERSSLGFSDIENDGASELRRFSLDGRVVKNSHKGINIIQMNDGSTQKVVVK